VPSFSVRRDAVLDAEDHIRIVLGPFADGRSGYVFAVNPSGARYDSLINPGGESDNPDWDGIWEAATARLPTGWSVEIRIPVHTLTFNPGLHEWQFNVQRRIQRRLETDRWASRNRQYQVTQTSRAGLLFSGERNIGRPATGDFTQTIAGARLRVNFSPDLSVSSYIQYDTDIDSSAPTPGCGGHSGQLRIYSSSTTTTFDQSWIGGDSIRISC
jgi:hypothetical protein